MIRQVHQIGQQHLIQGSDKLMKYLKNSEKKKEFLVYLWTNQVQ